MALPMPHIQLQSAKRSSCCTRAGCGLRYRLLHMPLKACRRTYARNLLTRSHLIRGAPHAAQAPQGDFMRTLLRFSRPPMTRSTAASKSIMDTLALPERAAINAASFDTLAMSAPVSSIRQP